MTAATTQTLKVYIVDFAGVNSRVGFFMKLVISFGIDTAAVLKGKVWSAFCRRLSIFASWGVPVCVRVVGLDDAYTSVPKECETLLRVLRAAKESNKCFKADAVIGDMKWKI